MVTPELIVTDFNTKWVAKQVGDSNPSTIVALSGHHRQSRNQGCITLSGRRILWVIYDVRAWDGTYQGEK